MNAFRLFLIHPIILFLNYILNGIILKRNEIEIQCRQFGLKRSCIFKVMNFLSFCPFSDFNLIFTEIFHNFS